MGYQIFTKQQNLRLVQIESICRRQIECSLDDDFCICLDRKHCRNKRKCWLQAFSPVPSNVFKSLPSEGRKKSGLCGKRLSFIH